MHPLNQILCGPPGTGKTYATYKMAVDICDGGDEKDREKVMVCYKALRKKDRIEFVTFHPSYAYEDFVEGIRPVLAGEGEGEGDGAVRYKIRPGVFRVLCDRARSAGDQKHVLIIDEINRGNLAKIFGELIACLEADKRGEGDCETEVTLPYSGGKFTVPNNVYVIGTMNTADRSISLMDFALRRRFEFRYFGPKFADFADPKMEYQKVAGMADAVALFEALNNKIVARKGRDFVIGHSYLYDAANRYGQPVVKSGFQKEVGRVLRTQVVPLLLEYFYEDWKTLKHLLGDKLVEPVPDADKDNDKVDEDEFERRRLSPLLEDDSGDQDLKIFEALLPAGKSAPGKHDPQ